MRAHVSPRGAVAAGLVAGATGTAVMTAAQTAYYKATRAEPSDTPPEVAKRIVRGVLQRDVSEDRTPLLNNVMHWGYGSSWGVVLGIAAADGSDGVVKTGLLFGTGVWAASLVHLPAMGLSPPIWKMPPSSIAPDVGFHLVYGLGAAAGLRALQRV